MRFLPANTAAERQALLEEYLLLCMQSRSRESALSMLRRDMEIVGKKLGIHGTKAAVEVGARALAGWLEKLFQ